MIQKCYFIEHFDEVMERLGGNEQMLIRLLQKFRTTYIQSRTTFTELIEGGIIEEAYRMVHSLKGVSANLGLNRVYQSSIILEQKMKLQEYESMQTEQDILFDELEMALGQIDKAFPQV